MTTRLRREFEHAATLREKLRALCERVSKHRCRTGNARQAGAAMQELWSAYEKIYNACGSLEELVGLEEKDG